MRSMRKRRVGVTARSRQIVGNQVTGTPQFATEIAAPLELRTPMGTCGEGRNQSADGSMVTMARELTGRMQSEKSRGGKQSMPGRVARCARMRRCLILRQGGKPPETPAPFPSESSFQNGGNLSRVRKPRNYSAPLTDSLRSEETTEMRERGPSARRPVLPCRPGGRARYARMRRCLILRQGASPLRPRSFRLTGRGHLMEAATVRERWLTPQQACAPRPRGHPVAARIGGFTAVHFYVAHPAPGNRDESVKQSAGLPRPGKL